MINIKTKKILENTNIENLKIFKKEIKEILEFVEQQIEKKKWSKWKLRF